MYVNSRDDKIKTSHPVEENSSRSSKTCRSTISIKSSTKELPKDRLVKTEPVENRELPVPVQNETNKKENCSNELIISSTSLDRLYGFLNKSGLYVLKLLFLGTEELIHGVQFIINSEEPWNLLSIVFCVCFEAFVYLVLALSTIFIATILSVYSKSPSQETQPLESAKIGTKSLSLLNQRSPAPKKNSQ